MLTTPPKWYKQLLCPLWPAWAKEVMPYRLAKMRERQEAARAYLGVTPRVAAPPDPDAPPGVVDVLLMPFGKRRFDRVWGVRVRRFARFIKDA